MIQSHGKLMAYDSLIDRRHLRFLNGRSTRVQRPLFDGETYSSLGATKLPQHGVGNFAINLDYGFSREMGEPPPVVRGRV